MSEKTKVTKATRYPLDFDALQKGDVIAQETIERYAGASLETDPDQYAFGMLALKGKVERHLNDRGDFWTLKSENNQLRILDDEEATGYNHNRFKLNIRRMVKHHRQALGVDRSQLGPEELIKHDRRTETQGRMLIFAFREDKEGYLPAAHIRSLPSRVKDDDTE